MQGDHEVSGSGLDTKHIESVSETDGNGRWAFKLFHGSSGTPGQTTITAWADFDFDDEFCDDEPADSAGVGWGAGEDAPSGSLPPAKGDCPIPSPAPTRTTTSSPTPSGSASPTGSSSPTTTSTTTSPDGRDTRRVNTSLSASYRRGSFKGRVRSSVGGCERGRQITLKKEKRRSDGTVGRTRSNRRGVWKLRKPRANGRFYAVVARKVFTRGDTRIVCKPARSDQVRA
jgi:hypothetical protein